MSHLARALLEALDGDDQALDELARLLAPRLQAAVTRPVPSDAHLLSPAAAAARLAVSRRTIYRALDSGELAAEKPRGQWRIAPADLDAWAKRSHPAPRRPRRRSARATAETNQAVAAISGAR